MEKKGIPIIMMIQNNIAILLLMIAFSFFIYGVDQYLKHHDTERANYIEVKPVNRPPALEQ